MTLLDLGKALNHANEWTIWSPAVKLTSQALCAPWFRTFCTLDLLYTVPVTIKFFVKPFSLPQWFILLHGGKWIDKRLVFRCYPLIFAWFFFCYDSIRCIKKMSLRIKCAQNIKCRQLEAKNLIVQTNEQFDIRQLD